MSIQGGFFESKLIGGVYDRAYSASEYADRWGRFVSNGISIIGGGTLTTENAVSIVEGTMTTQVEIGSGYINGYDYEVTSPEIVTHAAADPTNPRIDRVVIELNLQEATRAFVVKAVTGTPGAVPVAPALTRTDEIWQISLAKILVPANVVVLNTGTVTDERSDAAVCGLANVQLGITPPSGDAEVQKNTITRLVVDDTGVANAYVVNTVGTFDQTQEGNQLNFIPANSNTGASTITIDGQAPLTIKDIDDTGAKVTPEADRIQIGRLVRGYIDSGFFVLAPSAGGLKDYFGEGADGALNTAGNVTLTSVAGGPAIIKKYSSITINAGHTLTVSQPCQGLVLYSEGDVVINGTIHMDQKAGISNGGNIIPMLISNFKATDPYGIEAFNQLTTDLVKLTGGAGGNGGYGGGYNGSTGRTTGGTGKGGRLNCGGFGGGGGGGSNGDSGGTTGLGGNGGNIDVIELARGYQNSYVYNQEGFNGARRGISGVCGAGGGAGVYCTSARTVTINGGSGACFGGGGGGAGAMSVDYSNQTMQFFDGQYAGGFILIIAKGNITIGATGIVRANGGAGGAGGAYVENISGAHANGGGGGGGGAGGGVVALFHKGALTNSGTLQVNGGAGGAGGAGRQYAPSSINAENGAAGTSGSVGTIYTKQL